MFNSFFKHPIIMMSIAMVFTGASSAVVKGANAVLAIFLIGAIRYTVQGLVFLALTTKKDIKNPQKFKREITINTLLLMAANVTWFLALERAQAITVTMVLAILPMAAYVGSIFILKEKASAKALAGTIVAFIGTFILLSEPFFDNASSQSIDRLGVFFVLASTFFWTVNLIQSKRVLTYGSEKPMLAYRSLVVGIMFIIMTTVLGQWSDLTNITTESLLYLLIFVFLVGVLGNYLFFAALKQSKVQDASSTLFIEPLIGVIAGVVLLNEEFTTSGAVGGIIIAIGILIAHPIHYRHYLHMHHPHTKLEEILLWLRHEIDATRKKLSHL